MGAKKDKKKKAAKKNQSALASSNKKQQNNHHHHQDEQKKKETVTIVVDERGTTLKLKLVGTEVVCTNCIEENSIPTKKASANLDITKMEAKCAMCFTSAFDKKKQEEERRQEVVAQHQSMVKSKGISSGVKGLQNLGNTCFFNSVLQNLTHVNMLRDAFLEIPGQEKSTIKSINPLTMEMHHFFLKMYKQPSTIVSPNGLLSEISKKSPRFRGGKQQDSHELLRYLLDGLISDEQAAGVKKEPTYIDRIFGGRLISIITCFHCGNVSKTYEPFLDLSLPLPMLSVDKRPLPAIQLSPTPVTNRFTQLDLPADEDEYDEEYYRTIYDNLGGSSGGGKISKSKQKRLQKKKNAAAAASTSASSSIIEEAVPIDVQAVTNELKDKEQEEKDKKDNDNNGDQEQQQNQQETASPTTIVTSPDGADGVSIIMDESSALHPNEMIKEDYIKTDDFTPSPPVTPPQPTSEDITPTTFRESTDFILLGSSNNGDTPVVAHQEQILSTFSVIENYENPNVIPISPISISAGSSSHVDNNKNNNSDKNDKDLQNDPIDLRKGIPNEARSLDQLLACFLQFTNPEKLEGENGFICSKCAINGSPSKKGQQQEKKLEEKQEEDKEKEKDKEEEKDKKEQEEEEEKDKVNVIVNDIVADLLSTSLNEFEPIQDQSDTTTNTGVTPSDTTSPSPLPSPSTATSTPTTTTPSSSSSRKKKKNNNSPSTASGKQQQKKKVEEDEPIRRNASKQYLLSTTPPYLTVHLKRFMQTRNGGLQKNSKHIHFPHYLDLTPFTDPTCPKTSKQSHLYVLNGVVEHMGSMGSGHYVAHVYDDKGDQWHYISDSNHRSQSLNQVLENQAYVLFYKKVELVGNSNNSTNLNNEKVEEEDSPGKNNNDNNQTEKDKAGDNEEKVEEDVEENKEEQGEPIDPPATTNNGENSISSDENQQQQQPDNNNNITEDK